MEILQSKIQEINRLHGLAFETATNAMEYARQAGLLLMEVKKELKHGEFLSWVDINLNVSVRQAQRYMDVAKGKAIPIRALTGKYDTMSHLEKHRFVPEKGTISMLIIEDKNGSPDTDCLVESCKQHPNFFFVTVYISSDDETCVPRYTPRPIEAEAVHDCLNFFGKDDKSIYKGKWKVRNGGVMEAGESLWGASDKPPGSVTPKLSPRRLIFADGYSPEMVDDKILIDLAKTKIDGVSLICEHLL